MNIIHTWENHKIEKEINDNENIGFLLTSGIGGYFLDKKENNSRYNGWFVLLDKKLYKIIEEIKIIDSAPPFQLTNHFYYVEQKKKPVTEKGENSFWTEKIFLPRGKKALVYETNKLSKIEITLDIKESYDNRSFGRFYEILEEKRKNIVIIKFTKTKDINEDGANQKEYEIYLAIKPSNFKYQKISQWIHRFYSFDKNRNSPPFQRYVWRALTFFDKKIVFAVSDNKDEAIKEALEVFRQVDKLKSQSKQKIKNIFGALDANVANIHDKEIKMAYRAANYSLTSLCVETKNYFGLYAGLPWFFKFWTSDETICLEILANFNKDLSKKIIFENLGRVNTTGRLPDTRGPATAKNISYNTDAIGWLFYRISNLIKNGSTLPPRQVAEEATSLTINGFFDKKEIKIITEYLSEIIENLVKYQTNDGFAISGLGENWMDSYWCGDNRQGVLIEMQALRLAMYNLAFELTGNIRYKNLQQELLAKVKAKFWTGKILQDKLGDFTIRPNVFLACYIYPNLMTTGEWKICFDNILEKLWLYWGGLATIDKTSALFSKTHTGENPQSYHRGDSWFWLNNLAALVLYRIDKEKYNYYINKILEQSTEEILWHGLVGHHTELSSAAEAKSEGCLAQAWSAAMYIEAMEEIIKK